MANTPNVWTQMNYVPPRGQCNHKASILSPTCPCLRFMLHPLKLASSYECDGCGHHASFHSMENKAEDEIRKRWESEATTRAGQEEQRPKKRVRAIEYQELGQNPVDKSSRVSTQKKTRSTVARGKTRGTELADDEVVEVD
ncbi:hypothetical protein CFE70_000338 [Pyrenophora teres f. teres 0-1]|uniref:Uncharacterized protein n=2 Tax=Pyrenophora teres f. teres TaxID=97479 RepID=E3RJC2_PYRTT|nr:hypothetical protein PTT_08244 [Pyrenophora teres f. teres 0-1]KAE8836402.1 hypothetical protein HRS9139_04500 [Pyrenophora teres f. teres]KAE8837627.1 hypothetical protein PTNB85_04962 [Pyrenophora teres f. teres]KAE8839953.1 hypothetical protein HRS9122_06558 [Pyrenophora teres f. teres]KAE8862450.1 hypothetical protein PTNB29_05012 [Pyrenophora teres f. teres]